MIAPDTQSIDRESFAETSARLKDVIDKSGQIILWDACKVLGWTINKGAKVSSKMAESGDIYITDRMRRGRSIRILSSQPLQEQPTLDLWKNEDASVKDAQLEMQNAVINATIDMKIENIKDFIESFFDLSKLSPDRLKRLMNARVGTMILDTAAKSVGFKDGIFDERLRKVLARDIK